MSRHWYSLELTREEADEFRLYLKERNIMFEPSEAYNLIHFQCFMTMDEVLATNEWLDKLVAK